MNDSLEELYEQFLQQPSGDRFLTLSQLILTERRNLRAIQDWRRIQSSFRKGDFEWLIQESWEFIPAWLLAPRFHQILADAAEKTRDSEMEELEQFQLQQCLEGLMDTGEGSQPHPYHVVSTSDIHDIMAALDKTPVAQHCVQGHESLCDLVSCDDGSELWFRPIDMAIAPYQAATEEPTLQRT